MGLSHTESFSKEQNELATLAKAIGHPARVVIIELLLKKGCLEVNEIVKALPLAQPTVSQHLQKLLQAEIVTLQYILTL